MKAVLIRTGSGPIFHHHSLSPTSPRLSLSLHDYSAEEGRFSRTKNVPVHLEINRRPIMRSSSDSEMIRSQIDSTHGGSMFVPAGVLEETHAFEDEVSTSVSAIGSLTLNEVGLNRRNYTGDHRSMSGIPVEEVSVAGGGGGDKCRFTSTCTGGNSDRGKISEYYQEMLKADPMNPLLLRNYGKFLHEVEGNMKKAEEYYGRAILASPGDGEMLSLYANLIWQSERDEERTISYFDQAVQASPDDCMVLGSYAHFMWEAEDDGDEEDEKNEIGMASANSVVVKAF